MQNFDFKQLQASLSVAAIQSKFGLNNSKAIFYFLYATQFPPRQIEQILGLKRGSSRYQIKNLKKKARANTQKEVGLYIFANLVTNDYHQKIIWAVNQLRNRCGKETNDRDFPHSYYEIVEMICEGKTNVQICIKKNVTENTIATIVSWIFEMCGANDRVQLIVKIWQVLNPHKSVEQAVQDFVTQYGLPESQRNSLFLALSGLSNKEIAIKEKCSVASVKNRLFRVYRKLKLEKNTKAGSRIDLAVQIFSSN